MFMLSKIRKAMGHGSSGDSHTEGEATKSDKECKGKPKKEVEELLEQCSQVQEMDTQDFSDSPILFPSQTCDDKEKKEEEDSDCYEIVDRIDAVIGLEKENHVKELNKNEKSGLSLGRKRQITEQADESSTRDGSSSKQKRVKNEDNDQPNTTTVHKECCLLRVYKTPICLNIDEAERRNLFYAPKHVKPALYTPTIVGKLESYRWRLRNAQSSLRSYISPLRSKPIDPILPRSRGRLSGRIKRVSVMKKPTLDYKKWAQRRRNTDPFVAALCDILASKGTSKVGEHIEVSSTETLGEVQTSDDDVVCTKASHFPKQSSTTARVTDTTTAGVTGNTTAGVTNTTTAGVTGNTTAGVTNTITTDTTAGTSQHVDVIHDDDMETVDDINMETKDRDVPVETVDNDVEAEITTVSKETVKNDVIGSVKDNVVMGTVSNESSPVKRVLSEAKRKIILEEANSDDDFEKFNFQPSLKKDKTEEDDCVVVEAVAMETSHQKNVDHIECPMCYKKFPQETIQQHAFHCNGLNEASTSSVRTVQDGEMSPVIKTRTPTKVKELKLLAKVEIKANEFDVERMAIKKKPSERMEATTKQSHKRVSVEPSIKLTHFETKGMKCGAKNTSTPQPDNLLSQQRRLGVSNTRRNLNRRSWPDVASLRKDFIPLEFVGQEENKKIPSKDVRQLLSLIDTNDTDSSSDEELDQKKPDTSKKRSVQAGDDMSALSTMAIDYQSRKRKKTKNVTKNPKKAKVCSNDENPTEHCYICGKDIPRLQFTDHVSEEIERQRKQDEGKDFNLAVISSLSQTSDSACIENTTAPRSSLSLPDLAEGTTWQSKGSKNTDELKTKQFSGQSTQNKRRSARERRTSSQKM